MANALCAGSAGNCSDGICVVKKKPRIAMSRPQPHQPGNVDFARNLKILCSAHRSVADICRRTGINRQQFGRYLNGTYRPSRYNLMRICEVLGVREADLMLPEREFEDFINLRFSRLKKGVGTGWLAEGLEQRLPTMNQNLWKYLGWYTSFSYSFGWPNMVIRSLVSLHRYRGRVFSKTIDRVKGTISTRRFVYKNEGLVTISAGKIFIAEQDTLERDGFYLRVLEPTPRSHVGVLSGIMTGTSHRGQRDVSSVRLAMQYLGPSIDVRYQLSKCGIFKPEVHAIQPHILELIDNTIEEGQTVLHPKTIAWDRRL